VALTHTDGSRSSFDETILTTYIDGVWYIAAFQPVWEASDPVTAREVLAEPYTGKLFAAMQGGRWGFVDEYDNVVIPFEYLEAGEFSGGLARVGVSSGDMWGTRVCGFINTRNEFVVDPIYDYAGDFKDGLAPVNVGGTRDMGALRRGQWGFIDTTGRVVIPIKYNDFGEPAEGLVALKDGMYWGFVDMRGNTVIDFMFDWVGRGGDNFFSALGPSTLRSMISFGRNGHVGVSVNNAFGIIDRNGSYVSPLGQRGFDNILSHFGSENNENRNGNREALPDAASLGFSRMTRLSHDYWDYLEARRVYVTLDAFIVQDASGIFFGLYTLRDGLLYDTVYTRIRHDEQTNIITLHRGTDQTQVWIGPNGFARELPS